MIFPPEMEGLFKDGNIVENCTFMIIRRSVYAVRAPRSIQKEFNCWADTGLTGIAGSRGCVRSISYFLVHCATGFLSKERRQTNPQSGFSNTSVFSFCFRPLFTEDLVQPQEMDWSCNTPPVSGPVPSLNRPLTRGEGMGKQPFPFQFF